MLAMISPLSRSEASARAVIARSCARSRAERSSIAEAMSAVSAPAAALLGQRARRGEELGQRERQHAGERADDRGQAEQQHAGPGHATPLTRIDSGP